MRVLVPLLEFNLIRRPAETLRGVSTKTLLWRSWKAINATRQRVWKEQPRGFLSQAFIDIDGTIAPTLGECKGRHGAFL